MGNKWVCAPYVKVGFQNRILYVGFGSIQKKIEDSSKYDIYLSILSLATEPCSLKELIDQVDFNQKKVLEAWDFLCESRFLIPENTVDRVNRYSRHQMYYALSGSNPQLVQSKLEKATVLILGCGGIGNIVGTVLAGSGVGKLVLVDDDEIELTNLTRQFIFTEADIGKKKVDVLKEKLRNRNSSTEIIAIPTRINTPQDFYSLPRADVIVHSADSPASINWANDFCVETGTSFINVGYVNDIAVWGPFIVPGLSSCWECNSFIANERVQDSLWTHAQKINSQYQAPSFGPVNHASGAMAAMDVIKFIGGVDMPQSLNYRMGLWTHNMTLEKQFLGKNSACQKCGGLKQGAAHA